ncbi:MAG: START domain-containing protein [Gammaproteobacteria bacterium]|nr:START domain-containing protein [Gammaproteobacteria bacterium]
MMPSNLLAETTSSSWEKIREEQGIVVYAQEIEGSDVVRVKTQMVIEASLEEVQAFIEDISKRKKWVPFLAEARILKDYSPTERLEYTLFEAPWPASDRDFVYRRKLIYKDDEKIVMEVTSEESELMPEQDETVRAEILESRYTLLAVNDNKTKAELIFHADLKGWLPNWIINRIQQALPFRMLQNLRLQVEQVNSPQESE